MGLPRCLLPRLPRPRRLVRRLCHMICSPKATWAARARANQSFDRTYPVWFGSGANCFCKFYDGCDNHAMAKNRTLADASCLQTGALADVLVIEPWRGEVKVAPHTVGGLGFHALDPRPTLQ